MILDYFRPKTIDESLSLLNKYKNAIPIGGGSSVGKLEDDCIIVDLQDVDLNFIKSFNEKIILGATTSIDEVYQYFAKNISLSMAIQIDASKNQRVQGTIGGYIMTANGRSAFLTCLLALDCIVFIEPGHHELPLYKFLKNKPKKTSLITQIQIIESKNLRFESVGRSPLDFPILCCALLRLSDNCNIAIGGFGDYPQILQFDINSNDNLENRILELDLYDDQWATSKYRTEVACKLVKRLYSET